MKIFIIEDDPEKAKSWFDYLRGKNIEEKDIVLLDELPETEEGWEGYLLKEVSGVKFAKEGIVLLLDQGLYGSRSRYYDTNILVEKLLQEEILQKGDSIICKATLKNNQFKELKEISRIFNFKESEKYGKEVVESGGIRICNFDNFNDREKFILEQFSEQNIEIQDGGIEISLGRGPESLV